MDVDKFNSTLSEIRQRDKWVDGFMTASAFEPSHNISENGVLAIPVTLLTDVEISPLLSVIGEAALSACTPSGQRRWYANQIELTFSTPRVFVDGLNALVLARVEPINGDDVRVRLSVRNAETRRIVAVGLLRCQPVL